MHPTDWKVQPLGELVELHDRYRVPVSGRERALREGSTPYYGASGIIDTIDGYTHDGRYLLVAEDGENLRSRKTPIAFIATGRFWANNHVHVLKVRGDRASDIFLKAYVDSQDINGWVTGAAQPKLSQANLVQIPVTVPPMPVQHKIAAVLSAYDELIQNNLRRIEILEEMAQAVYREWFVEFRFPGYEDVEMVASESGPIPEGWKMGRFKALATSTRSNVDPSASPDTVFAHYSFAAFDASRSPTDDLGNDLKSGKLALVEPAVLVAKLNPRIPRVWRVSPDPNRRNITSSEFLVLRPTASSSLSHLYCAVNELREVDASLRWPVEPRQAINVSRSVTWRVSAC